MGVSLLKKGVARKLITYLFSLRAAPGYTTIPRDTGCSQKTEILAEN